MAVAWFIVPYQQVANPPTFVGTSSLWQSDLLNNLASITADAGAVVYERVRGGFAIAKVRASAATLTALNALPGWTGINAQRLDDPLSTFTQAQLLVIRNKVISLGYTSAEITNALGSDLSLITLGQLLRFIASTRFAGIWDPVNKTMNWQGGAHETPLTPDQIDPTVQ